IATSSCLAGMIPQALMRDDARGANEYVSQFIDLFGREQFFIEIMDHGIKEQYKVNTELVKMAAAQNLRMIATNDCHYMKREDADMHDVLLCIQTGCCRADTSRFKFDGNEFYVKSAEEMATLFRDYKDAVLNTRLVAEMC